jgi:hypothetical protein
LAGNNQVLALWSQAGVIRVHLMGSTHIQVRGTQRGNNDADATAPAAKDRTIEISNTPVLVTGANLAIKGLN